MKSKLLTTGQAAKLCSVTPDTILKWIRSGRLPAQRTPGGHHRILQGDLQQIFTSTPKSEEAGESQQKRRLFRYCWEYNSNGKPEAGCRQCIVYQMRAHRCYEAVERAKDVGHNKIFCKVSCSECDYYKKVHQQELNVLVITNDELFAARLKQSGKPAPFNLEIANCEYNCSMLVELFRPDYVFVDCALGLIKTRDITGHLMADPRIPHVRVIMAAGEGEYLSGCDRDVFATITKPFGLEDILECVEVASDETG